MPSTISHLWISRIAIANVFLTLMTIATGDFVSSTGIRNWSNWPVDSVLAVLGICAAVGLVLVSFRGDERPIARVLTVAILICVVACACVSWKTGPVSFGVPAMTIGLLRVMTLIGLALLLGLTGHEEHQSVGHAPIRQMEQFRPLALLTCLATVGQYALGAAISYLGTGLHEHIGGSVILSALCLTTLVTAIRSRSSALIRLALGMITLLVIQIGLGAAAWVAKFGFAASGYVAIQGSPLQIWTRAFHASAAGLMAMTAVIYGVRLFQLVARQQRIGERRHEGFLRTVQEASERAVVKGGIA